jgi:saccharopine dehydrogenase-like NADP-dependent oxidoreductase
MPLAAKDGVTMAQVLVIGAGGVGSVAVHKMAMNADIFTGIALASRTKSKCDAIAASVKERTGVDVATYQIDADDVAATTALINDVKPVLVVNLALPYQDLRSWMRAWRRACTIWTPPTTNRATKPSSNTSGSGPIRNASRKRA